MKGFRETDFKEQVKSVTKYYKDWANHPEGKSIFVYETTRRKTAS